jgi:hypothetical protein
MKFIGLLMLFALLPLAKVEAQTNRLPVLEVPFAVQKPRMDASSGDSAWKTGAVIPSLSYSIGVESGGRPPLPTRVLALWDEAHLYLRFVCTDPEIYVPFAGTQRDQPLYKADVVEVFLDVKGDGRQYYELQANAKNQVFDQNIVLTAEPRSNELLRLADEIVGRDFWPDLGWTMDGLQTAASQTPDSWTVDFAIPASVVMRRLGTDKFSPMNLRANLLRYEYPRPATGDKRSLHAQNWAPVQIGCPHISPQAMGFLKLLPRR